MVSGVYRMVSGVCHRRISHNPHFGAGLGGGDMSTTDNPRECASQYYCIHRETLVCELCFRLTGKREEHADCFDLVDINDQSGEVFIEQVRFYVAAHDVA